MRLLLLLSIFFHLSIQDCSWNTCNKWSSDKNTLNVHLIPHTHDDMGWIKTVDQYYYGAKPELVPVGVQYIYNTVIDELQKSPERKFSFAETGFLWRWYSSNGDAEKHRLQKLIKTGQIELIGGGWTQNDEAGSHYVDIVDQMTFGLKKLGDLFGDCGKAQVAWQIDPFGHSREQANLFAQMGYSSLFFARIHYLEKEARLENKTLEFVWNASDDLRAFYQDNYGPPPGFCWDALCGDDPMMDNPDLEEYNVDQKVADFVSFVRKQASYQRSNHVMLLMGSDFQYTNANSWYSNLDKLIRYVNGNSSHRIKVFYSTPSCYVKGLLETQPRLTSKDDDFFPYASSEHSYWTGYFTSRPTFKGMIRDASSLLQLAKRLDVLADLGPSDDSDVEIMQKASALVQHHDAVTGTAKQNVTKDYYKHLGKAFAEGETVVNDFLKVIMPKTSVSAPPHKLCHLINETICEIIVDVPTFAVTIFNPLGQDLSTVITIPFYSKQAIVQNDEGQVIESQIFKTFQSNLSKPKRAPYELSFSVQLPPLGYRTFVIDNSTSKRSSAVKHPEKKAEPQGITISNEFISLTFDSNGCLASFTDLATKETKPFKQQFYFYTGVDDRGVQTSGAYIFRPKEQNPFDFNVTLSVETSKGNLTQEVRQIISPWVSQIIRLRKGSTAVEFDWTVGPIPKETNGSPITKEIVTRYITDIKSANVFYTDSNGRQMMRRKVGENPSFVYQDTEPMAGNYYPVTNRVFIKDDSKQMTVLTDRSQGATSRDGMIELMLHRRCFVDDHWGVEEALDELGSDGKGLIARGTHFLLLTQSAKAATIHRPKAMEIFNRPLLAFSPLKDPAEFRKNNNLKFSGMSRSLPSFVNLLSMEKWHKTSLLLRFEHIFQSEEDKENSKPMIVDIKNLFTRFDILSINELMLAGNRNATTTRSRSSRLANMTFQLKPQEIKTFEVKIKRK